MGNGTWFYVVATLSGSPRIPRSALHQRDAEYAGTGEGNWSGDDSAQSAYLGFANFVGDAAAYGWGSSGSLNGSEDEFRISNVVRSADWIATEYINAKRASCVLHLVSREQDRAIPSKWPLRLAVPAVRGIGAGGFAAPPSAVSSRNHESLRMPGPSTPQASTRRRPASSRPQTSDTTRQDE